MVEAGAKIKKTVEENVSNFFTYLLLLFYLVFYRRRVLLAAAAAVMRELLARNTSRCDVYRHPFAARG